MSKSFDAAQLEAKILRYLLVEGRPVDFGEIRDGAELGQVARGKIWAAIRAAIDTGWISYAYRLEQTTYEGFKQTLSYPVFWVQRESLVRDAGPVREWWRAAVARAGGEGEEVRS